MRLLNAAGHRRMRWKNGKGETIEIAVEPVGAALDAFDWRVSTAAVVEDGPFSEFPGIDRTLAVLTGGPLELAIGSAAPVRLAEGEVSITFAADAPCTARLLGVPVTDLNVMTRRSRQSHTLVAVREGDRAPVGAVRLVVAAPGSMQLRVGLEAVRLEALDALQLEVEDADAVIDGGAGWLVCFGGLGS